MAETSSNTLKPPLSSSTLSVQGRVFLISGGTQGLGLEVARRLQQAGAAGLLLVSRSEDKGKAAIKQLETPSCQVFFLKADLANATDAESVFPKAEEILPGKMAISGVVNAAAITERGNLLTETAAGFDLQMAVNVRAPFLITQGAARHMIHHGVKGGSIVNICSVAAYGGAPFVMAYSAAKAALVNLTKNNAAELAPKGIRVNGVNMGWCYTENEDKLQTRQTDAEWIQRADASVPLGRILRPTDIAATVHFLLSDASAMMTASIIDQHPEFPNGMISLQDKDSR